MKALSLDLRNRIVRAYLAGGRTQAEIAEVFGVSERTVKRLWRKWRETGDLRPDKVGGRRPRAIVGQALRRLKQAVRDRPDATLEELLEACGVSCSTVTVHNTLKRLGYRRKKNAARL